MSVYITFCQFILLTDTWVASTFWQLWTILPWTWVHKYFFWDPTFSFFKYIPRSGNGGSYGNSMFNFLKNCHTVFHNGYIVLHSHQQDQFVHILTSAYFLFFSLIVAILIDVRLYYIVVLICISLISSTEHLYSFGGFGYLLWRNVFSDPLPILKVSFFLVVSSLCILDNFIRFAIFSPFLGLKFHCCTLWHIIDFNFDVVQFICVLFNCRFFCGVQEIIVRSDVMKLFLHFFIRVLSLVFRSLIHFELTCIWFKVSIHLFFFLHVNI